MSTVLEKLNAAADAVDKVAAALTKIKTYREELQAARLDVERARKEVAVALDKAAVAQRRLNAAKAKRPPVLASVESAQASLDKLAERFDQAERDLKIKERVVRKCDMLLRDAVTILDEPRQSGVLNKTKAAVENAEKSSDVVDPTKTRPMPAEPTPNVGASPPSSPAATRPAEEPQHEEPSPPPALPTPSPADLPQPPSPEPSGPTRGAQYLQRQVDPFFLQPLVSVIPPAEQLSDFAVHPQPSPASDGRTEETVDDCFVIDHRFVQPARFPLLGFGFNGECLDEPGAVVYEGMRLAIRPDGRYQVRFTVGTPAMPVTMQLQFELVDECTGTPYTLTLPPIVIPPEAKRTAATMGNPVQAVAANVQTIHHEGYFAALDTCLVSNHLQVMRRTGTARFGFGVDVP